MGFWPCISVFFSYDLEGRGQVWGMIFDFTKLSADFFFVVASKGKLLLKLGESYILRPLPRSLPIICVYVFAFFFKEVPQNLL